MYNEAMNGSQNNMQMQMPMNGQPMMGYPMLNMSNFQRVWFNGDQIVNMDNVVIGVKKEVYEELMGIAEEYKRTLEEHGLIEKEKTPEELAAEQTQILTKVNGALESILDRMDRMDDRINSLEGTSKEAQHGTKRTETAADGIKSDRSKSGKTE